MSRSAPDYPITSARIGGDWKNAGMELLDRSHVPRLRPVRLRDELLNVADREIVGLYVHGSAVLGDFIAGTSDLDLLVVVDDNIEHDSIDDIA